MCFSPLNPPDPPPPRPVLPKHIKIKHYILVFHILPKIFTENHATFPVKMYAITV